MIKLTKLTVSTALLLIALVIISGCTKSDSQNMSSGSNTGTAATNTGKRISLSLPESKLEWVGKKVTGQHNGTVDISKGDIYIDDGKLTGGNFEINFASIKVLDLQDAGMNAKLTEHLKSEDFFSAEKFPSGKFEISTISPLKSGTQNNYMISGNLTIKGISKPISFPAEVTINGDALSARADIKIDRTLWDVKFRSGKFYENLGDKLISDEIELKLDLKAKN